MQIYKNYDEFKLNSSYIALGSFDGVHLGHQQLIHGVINKSKEDHVKSLVYTFREHPRKTLNKEIKIELLTQNEKRLEIFQKMGLDGVFLDDFNIIRNLAPEDFVKEILVNRLKIKYAVVGYNYHFGRYSNGDDKLLQKLGEKYGFGVHVVSPIMIHNNLVSSSLIRNLVMNARICQVKQYLGRNYSLVGTVVSGKQNGRKIGVPTANIVIHKDCICPTKGVYDTNTIVEGITYKSITNIGKNPTFQGQDITIETHILDFHKDIYGYCIEVEFLKKSRDEVKFQHIDDLIKQLKADVEARRNLKMEEFLCE